MPAFNEDDLKDHIASGRIGAVSLDTSIFDRYDCNLASQALLGMSQFRDSRTQFLLSEVVVSEIKSHILSAATDAQVKLKSALVQFQRRWQRTVDEIAMEHLLGLGLAPERFAESCFTTFAQATQLEIVRVDDFVTHSEVLRRYFTPAPPFAEKGRQKGEFPDALALLSLEAWATQRQTITLVVSRDGDWQSFAEGSERLICVPELGVALDYFNQEARFVVERAVGLLLREEAPELGEGITGALDMFFENFDPELQASSSLDYEVENLEPTLLEWKVAPELGAKVMNADANTVVFSLAVDASVLFEATFLYSIRDSIDRDYVELGSDTKAAEETLRIPLVIAIEREIVQEPNVKQIDITPVHVHIDFGSIDPDWGHEE